MEQNINNTIMKEHSKFIFISIISIFCLVFLFMANVYSAHAGCGCDKPVPPPASIIPQVTYPGTYIRIYDDSFELGEKYKIEFKKEKHKSEAICDVDRDGRKRLKVFISEKIKRIGPTEIKVKLGKKEVLKIKKENFTLAPKPIFVPSEPGTYEYKKYKAAVDKHGTVYIALDLTEVRDPVTIVGTLLDYPLWIEPEDVIIFNSQGFIMTELVDYDFPIPLPGMDVIYEWNDPQRSDSIIYWRHEFNTYYAEHDERECFFSDPTDPDYHMDGTPHIDHNQLIFAISGIMADGKVPGPAGKTPDITLSIGIFYDDFEALDFVNNPPENLSDDDDDDDDDDKK